MGKGGRSGDGEAELTRKTLPVVTWDEVKTHDKHDDKWLVINGEVYDITKWSRRHPGGSKVISHYAGQDATDAFQAFHNDQTFVRKYLKPIHVGTIDKPREAQIDKDFRELRKTAEQMGLFRPSVCFFVLSLAHILLLEAAAYFSLAWFGTGWLPYLVSLLCYSTVQAQTGWLQHDFGHLSVFQNRFNLDHILHFFTMGFTKGASPGWWNHMHYQHHAKPNVMGKDPDVRVEELFVVGNTMPVEIAKNRKKSSIPYNWQHRYFFVVGPPLLFPVYFQFMLFRHIFTRRAWADLAVVTAFFVKFFYLYVPMLGLSSTIIYYFLMRCIESHWFTWVSQSNHIPMDIEHDQAEPWLALQMHATCDIEKSFFNDWFTGHLNFQIEHHLFPTMPRHNLYKIAPLVESLCKKHNVPYKVKGLWEAFVDIPKSLKHSGELWYSTYQAFHSS